MQPSFLPENYESLIDTALAEDVGGGDRTTESLVPPEAIGTAAMCFKQDGILAGSKVVARVFNRLDSDATVTNRFQDGEAVKNGEVALEIEGLLRALLTAERTALNFMQRMSGVASLTQKFVEAVDGTGVQILDTRKTIPGWRAIEKYSVQVGGGTNHRFGLFDQVLIKDNHLEAVRSRSGSSLPEAVASAVHTAKQECPGIRIEVEIEDEASFQAAVEAQADIIMLDNRSPVEMKQMIQWLDKRRPRGEPGRPILEASGGITLKNVRQVAKTGVDWISLGALTHSAPALDISMEIQILA